MSIKELLSTDINNAMRARDKVKLNALRLIAAAVKQVEVDKRCTIDDQQMIALLAQLAKQRKESITQFKAAGREDLVSKEQIELEIINHYLPEPLSLAELDALISQAIVAVHAEKISDLGKVMAYLKPHVLGKTDMAEVSSLIKAKLS